MNYRSLLPVLILAFCCSPLFFYRLADRDLWSSHEGRAAQDAQTMLWDNAWGLPKLFDGRADLQKPPFYYWLVAFFGWLRGGHVDAWAVRLPPALSATGTVLWVFALGSMRKRKLAGFIATLALATMLHFTSLARTGRIDMVLCFAISVALGSFYLGFFSTATLSRCLWLFFGYIAIAVAVLLKGPIGFVLPVAVVFAYLLCEKSLPSPKKWRAWASLLHSLGLWWGIPLLLGLTLPWFLWVNDATNGEFFRVFFWHHNIERGLGASDTLARYPWWYYGPRILLDLLPWSLLFPVLAWLFFRKGWQSEEPLARFALVWFLVIIGLLSLARFKRADYLLPAYPGAALFFGICVQRWFQENEARRRWAVALVLIVFVYMMGWWIYVSRILPNHEPHREQHTFAKLIRTHRPLPEPVIFFRVEDHALAFHVGRPVDTIMEWENIDVWAGRPGTYYIVMTPDAARDWPLYVSSGCLEEVARNTDSTDGLHESPLVLMRTCSHPP